MFKQSQVLPPQVAQSTNYFEPVIKNNNYLCTPKKVEFE